MQEAPWKHLVSLVFLWECMIYIYICLQFGWMVEFHELLGRLAIDMTSSNDGFVWSIIVRSGGSPCGWWRRDILCRRHLGLAGRRKHSVYSLWKTAWASAAKEFAGRRTHLTHLRLRHKRDNQYACSGTKQIKIILSLHDADCACRNMEFGYYVYIYIYILYT